jgi:hypothetical protein
MRSNDQRYSWLAMGAESSTLQARVSERYDMKDVFLALIFFAIVIAPAILALDIFEKNHF